MHVWTMLNSRFNLLRTNLESDTGGTTWRVPRRKIEVATRGAAATSAEMTGKGTRSRGALPRLLPLHNEAGL